MLLLNPFAWLAGAVTCFLVAYKVNQGLQSNINIVAKQQVRFFSILAISFLFYSIPPLLIADANVLEATYLIADGLLFLALIFQGIIFWSLFLHKYVRKSLVVTLLALLGAIALYASHLSPPPVYNGILIDRNLTQFAAILQGIVIAIPLLPNGIYFVFHGFNIPKFSESIKSIGLGLLYLIVAGQQVYIDIFQRGRETLPLTVLNIVAFVIFTATIILFTFEENEEQ